MSKFEAQIAATADGEIMLNLEINGESIVLPHEEIYAFLKDVTMGLVEAEKAIEEFNE